MDEYGSRAVDGSGVWTKASAPTKEGPNDGSAKNADAICNIPTPTSSPTSTPTSTPTSKPTATSTPNPTPTKQPTLAKTATFTPTQTMLSNSELSQDLTPQVLSLGTDETNPDSTQASLVSSGKAGGVPTSALLMIAGGIVFSGVGVVSIVRRRKSPYNEVDNEEIA